MRLFLVLFSSQQFHEAPTMVGLKMFHQKYINVRFVRIVCPTARC